MFLSPLTPISIHSTLPIQYSPVFTTARPFILIFIHFPLSIKVSFYLLMDLDLRMVKKQSSLFLSLLVRHQSVLISGITCSGLQCQTWIFWFKQYVTFLTQLNLQFQAVLYIIFRFLHIPLHNFF